jgi:hypothetical protein
MGTRYGMGDFATMSQGNEKMSRELFEQSHGPRAQLVDAQFCSSPEQVTLFGIVHVYHSGFASQVAGSSEFPTRHLIAKGVRGQPFEPPDVKFCSTFHHIVFQTVWADRLSKTGET